MRFSSLLVMVNVALVFYMGMEALGKDIMNKPVAPINYFEFSFFRSVFLMVTSYLLISRYDVEITDVPKDCRLPLIFRCLVGTATFVITTVSLKILPITIYTIVLRTSPIMTAILQWVWLRERVTCLELIAIIGAYNGIIVMSIDQANTATVDS